MPVPSKDIGMRLREARKKLKLSQTEVAVQLDLPRTAILRIEDGQRHVNGVELAWLCELYKCDPADILGVEVERSNKPKPRNAYIFVWPVDVEE